MSKTSSINKRYLLSSLTGVILATTLGIVFGLVRHNIIDLSIFHIVSGLLIAIVFQKLGHSIKFRFAFTAVFLTLISMVISDIVAAYGLKGLSDIDLMVATYEYFFSYDLETIIWLSYRGLALYIAYTYSRII